MASNPPPRTFEDWLAHIATLLQRPNGIPPGMIESLLLEGASIAEFLPMNDPRQEQLRNVTFQLANEAPLDEGVGRAAWPLGALGGVAGAVGGVVGGVGRAFNPQDTRGGLARSVNPNAPPAPTAPVTPTGAPPPDQIQGPNALDSAIASLRARVEAIPEDNPLREVLGGLVDAYEVGDVGAIGRLSREAGYAIEVGNVYNPQTQQMELDPSTIPQPAELERVINALALASAPDPGEALDRREAAVRRQRGEATDASDRAYQRHQDSLTRQAQADAAAAAARTEARVVEDRDLAAQDREREKLAISNATIQRSIDDYFGTPAARASGMEYLRETGDPMEIAGLAATVANAMHATGDPVSSQQVIAAVQGAIGGGSFDKPITQAARGYIAASGPVRPQQTAGRTGNARAAAPATAASQRFATQPEPGAVRPLSAPVGGSRRSTEPGEISGAAPPTARPGANPIASRGPTPNFGGRAPSAAGPRASFTIGRSAPAGIAGQVAAGKMTTEEADGLWGGILSMGESLLGPNGYEDLGFDPDGTVTALLGAVNSGALTVAQATGQIQNLVATANEIRTQRRQEAEDAHQQGLDQQAQAWREQQETRRQLERDQDTQRQDAQRQQELRIGAGNELTRRTERQTDNLAGIESRKQGARSDFVNTIMSNVENLAPPTQGARLGGSDVIADLVRRAGMAPPEFAGIGGPQTAPDFDAMFADEFQRALAETVNPRTGQPLTADDILAESQAPVA